MTKMTIYCDKCGADITSEQSQLIDLGRSKSYDLCLKCYDSITEKLADVENEIIGKEEKPEACYKCAYYSEYSKLFDDNGLAIICGSCIKCKRNFTTTDPFNRVPSWCPLKGE